MTFTTSRLAVVLCLVSGVVLEASDSKQQNLRGPRATDSLRFLVVVSRHGNRPIKDYITDPYPSSNATYWPGGEDQITPVGRRQMYDLGGKIRSLYDGFLQPDYHPEVIKASSVNLPKTLMSGEAFMAGLYPPTGTQMWNSDIKWQPTALSSDSPDKTAVINNCPKYVEETKKVTAKFMKDQSKTIDWLMNYYNWGTGNPVAGLKAVEALYHLGDKLITEELEGYTIPSWTKRIYPEPLSRFVSDVYLNLYAGTVETTRLMIGSLLEEVVNTLDAKIAKTLPEERKVLYYSGHDSSIVALQVALRVRLDAVVGLVKPGSALVLELHQHTELGYHYVKAGIMNGPSSEVRYLSMGNCGRTCIYEFFAGNTRKYTGVNYEEECKTTFT